MKLAAQGSRRSILIAVAFIYPSASEAHSPIQGMGTFYNHLLHPLVVPSQALLLIAIALMLGQQGRSIARVGIVSFGLAFAAGLTVATVVTLEGEREWILLFGTLVVGSAVCLDWRIPGLLVTFLAAGAGITIGLDSALSTAGLRDTALAAAGGTVGVLYLTIVIAGLTVAIEKHWQRVAIRIAGSWILAVSIMVLTLSIAGTAKRTAALTGCVYG